MRDPAAVTIILAAALAAPATALAQAPATTTTPAPAPAPAAEPAAGRLQLVIERANGRHATVLAGRRFRVRGIATPYVAGQRVTVRFYRGRKKLAARRVTLRRAGSGGQFVVGYRAQGPGRITVRASHRATPQLGTMVARARGVDVLPRAVAPGSRGRSVRILQQRLRRLGYVVGRRGLYDGRTARAVLAFRKVSGLPRTTSASGDVMRRLARGAGAFRVRYRDHGRHVEADLSRQVIALIGSGGRVERVYHTSSGAASTPTILGSYRVYRKDPGTNAVGMVHSSYFIRGYAIHGYRSVPTGPASHGCLRVPIPDALSIFRWIRHGTRVDVYP